MCNLYNITTNQDAIRAFVSFTHDNVGNLEPSLDIYPDRLAPIIRNIGDGQREFTRVRWGMPSSSQALFKATTARADKLRAKGKEVDFNALLKVEPDGGTTNIRKTTSKHWTRWLGVPNRCVVPVTRFAEPDPGSKIEGGRTPNAWFARDDNQPLMFFAGAWVSQWESVRKVKDGLQVLDLFAFLTTDANDTVGAVHPKAMPVLLTEPEEVERWLTEPWETAQHFQKRTLPNEMLVRVTPSADAMVA
jgi:putative SOS response-associated peptidase YedK